MGNRQKSNGQGNRLRPQTSNLKPQTSNLKLRTSNLKLRTSNLKPISMKPSATQEDLVSSARSLSRSVVLVVIVMIVFGSIKFFKGGNLCHDGLIPCPASVQLR